MNSFSKHSNKGFTIVELLIVVVVIAILAAITIVAYNGITASAKESALKSDLTTAIKKLQIEKVETGTFPASTPKPSYLGNNIQYTRNDANSFCATASADGKAFYITQDGTLQTGTCPGHTVVGGGGGGGGAMATTMQTFTQSHCSDLDIYTGSNPGAIVSLTDNRGGTTQTYEVAKLADNKCWMLTNLKLGSTTGPITLTPADSNVASNFTLPQITIGGTSSYDTPTASGPVTDDTGSGATNYGYLYNWPAATAGESTASHDETKGNAPHSICPANWRMPTGGWNSDWSATIGDFPDLDRAFGGNGEGAWSGESNIAKWQYTGPFKGVFSGLWWDGSFYVQGGTGYVWSSSARPDDADFAFNANFGASHVDPGGGGNGRGYGMAVRCLLN